jgi:uncharacterized membrane protein YGL010W
MADIIRCQPFFLFTIASLLHLFSATVKKDAYHLQNLYLYLYILYIIYINIKLTFGLGDGCFLTVALNKCSRIDHPFSKRAFLRAFFAIKFGSALNFLYLCIVNEKRRICGLTG